MKRSYVAAALLLLPVFAHADPNTLKHPGRTLAANCFQCHGTDGYGMEHLAGKSASSIKGELNEMKWKTPGANIMNVHAQAYTDAEINLIADYFSKLPK